MSPKTITIGKDVPTKYQRMELDLLVNGSGKGADVVILISDKAKLKPKYKERALGINHKPIKKIQQNITRALLGLSISIST